MIKSVKVFPFSFRKMTIIFLSFLFHKSQTPSINMQNGRQVIYNSLDTNSTHNCILVHTFTSLSCSVYRTRYVVCTIHSRHTCRLPGLPAKPNHHIPRQLCFSYHDTMAGFINFHPKNMMHLCNPKSMKVLLKYFYPTLTFSTKKILLMPYKSYLT